MSAHSLKISEKPRRNIAPRGEKSPPSLNVVRECLSYGGITAKQWACELSVGERRVHKWRSGEDPVPHSRRLEILIKFQDLLTQQLLAINSMVSRALREAYGADPGVF